MKRLASLCAVVAMACEEPAPKPPVQPPPIDRCEALAPLSVQVTPAEVRANGSATLEVTGGTGRYTFAFESSVTGGTLSANRYLAGPSAGIDVVRVKDECEQTADVPIEVRPTFDVQPSRATVRPRTTFQIRVSGAKGPVAFSASTGRLESGGSVSSEGAYEAGTTEGLDVVVARDTGSGDQALLQIRVKATAQFRARPSKIAVPSGSVVPLETLEGSGVVSWRLTGPGILQGSTYRAEQIVDGGVVGVTGTATLEARDAFTMETATASVRVLTELTRPMRAQGRRSDVGNIAVGDFNGDGRRDVALGVPESDLKFPQGGAVFIFMGTDTGLPREPDHVIDGDTDTAQLGVVMAVGDLDGDGKDDLAISEPGADVTIADSGAVVLYRITERGPERLRAPLTGLGRGNFGAALDIADVDGDGDADLVVGSPGADLAPTGAINSRGVVDIFLSEKGKPLPDLGSVRLGGQDLAVDGTLRPFTNLRAGRAVVARDLNADGRVDLAILSSVNNSLLGGTPLARGQIAVQVHLGRAMGKIESKPDAYVLPTNTADGTEGTWRLGFVPASGGVGPFLIAAADQADSPNLMAMGGNPAGTNAGGALLFDLRGLSADAAPADRPAQLGRADTFAQLYGDQAGIQAARSFAVADLDGDEKPELILGAPYATTTTMLSGVTTTFPNAGRLLVYSLGSLTKGAQQNRTMVVRHGAFRTDTLGIAVGAPRYATGVTLLGYAGRATTDLGDFTGRLDAFTGTGLDLSTWTRASVSIENKPASQGFGQVLDVASGPAGLRAVVGVPNISGAGLDVSGNETGAGQVHLFSIGAPNAPVVLQEGATTRYVTDAGVRAFGGRPLGSDVTMTDFDGDMRPDLVFSAPALVVPARFPDGGVPSTEYAGNRTQCFQAGAQTPGGAFVYHQRTDGTFVEAFRIWAPVAIENCVVPDGGAAAVCQRSSLGRNGMVGGFDFNGDRIQDLALSRTNGIDVMFGRAPDDGSYAKPSIACDMGYSLPNVSQGTTLLAALGDVNGDGCDDVGLRYGDRQGFIVVFGFDATGGRCGTSTAGSWVRVAGDAEVGLPTIRVGVAMARAGQFLSGDTRDFIAVTADLYSFEGTAQPTVLLYDSALLSARKPASGGVVMGALADGIDPVPLVSFERSPGFGRQLVGRANVVGDAKPDLVVSSPGASLSGDGTGVVFVYAGGSGVPGRNEPAVTVFPDIRERASFGVDLGATSATGTTPAALIIGAPTSYRSGTANGTAFVLPMDF